MSTARADEEVPWERCVITTVGADTLCRGVQVSGFNRCLAHLNTQDSASFLGQVSPGADLDLRGTPLDSRVLNLLMQALTSPGSAGETAVLGEVDFAGATFTEYADFAGATFTKTADFTGATFTQKADFAGATFTDYADFAGATFTQNADFYRTTFAEYANFAGTTFTMPADFAGTTFTRYADFAGATFTQKADFVGATFTEYANFAGATFIQNADFYRTTFTMPAVFAGATFTRYANFPGATFTRYADFAGATFTQKADFASAIFTLNAQFTGASFLACERLGPLVANVLDLRSAQFGTVVVLEAEVGEMLCQRARFSSGAELRVRYGRVDLAEVFLGAASSLTSATAFTELHATGERIEEWRAANYSLDHRAVLSSLRGTDVSELALTDVDLRWCRFAGAHHLDKLRVEGDSPFPRSPQAWLWRSARQVLYEECRWRAAHNSRGWAQPASPDEWRDRVEPVTPDRLAALYRSLRKALEDGKNEAGAGDFYYGEQEARRRAAGTSLVERAILWAYWLISGYGQRASRALVALLGVITVTTVLLITCGLSAPGPASQSTTIARGLQTITVVEDIPPRLPPDNARWTWSRLDASARIAMLAVVFRDASQKLTTAGAWTVMVARFAGPILLALAALAVRARVKR